MSATVVVGLQYGDEGKGKIVDWLSRKFTYVVRYNGGPNAGHTVENGHGKFALHQVPSGIFNPEARCFLGSGAVVAPAELADELTTLSGLGIAPDNFRVSGRAHVILPWHRLADRLSEAALGGKAIGTTGRGIGPCYADKTLRRGVLMRDVFASGTDWLEMMFDVRLAELRHLYPWQSVGKVIDEALGEMVQELRRVFFSANLLGRHIADTDELARQAWRGGEEILLEGAQGTMIDLQYGTYPHVSSSTSTAAGACIGSGLPPKAVAAVIGIAKAYTTRVGNGPMPTELLDETGDRLCTVGHEFGTTTGRPRRCGWFDAAAVKYACEVNGADGIILTKLDVLSGMDELKIAVAHDAEDKPVYESVKGWSEPIRDKLAWYQLPAEAKRYVERLEELVGVRIKAVATGPGRHAIIQI